MQETYAALLQKLTPAEKIHLILFPEQAPSIRHAVDVALFESQRRFRGGARNTASDAFRHCFWSALVSRDIGYGSALRYTKAHEDFPDNPPAEKAMDLHNNAVGLNIGRFGGEDQIVASRCMAALTSGKLKIIES